MAKKQTKRAQVYDPALLTTSDEAVRRGSGKSWADWIAILDTWGATDKTHGEIARFLTDEKKVPSWWAQSVTVGYERVRGMRALHGGPDGFRVGVSKTFATDVDTLFEAFTNARRRNRWLETGTLKARTSQPGKSARFDFKDGTSRVHVYFTSKGDSKAAITIEHERLANEASVEATRTFWKERLAALAEVLAP